ncbi:DUF3299 domain-containing protein [Variovorax sp. PCZ-1]|uniref:DUF3299 domain-containing protein n=1 Tax=Variovorax sp. PCZ-1 TaxID=2835533 RepID=UPI001BCCD912|nr:DUF3299 domain-containing protein [Variovorax sp. PCZ-1]MBS7808346.1 DUF3299 domain-containing protein [Variovorax sp. PCZ-1]
MSTKQLVIAGLAATAVLAWAQQSAPQLSSPIASGAKPAASSPLGVPQGQGAGVHSPNSPFAPLPKREDVVAWSVLTAITTKNEKNKILPVFGAQQMALHQKTQKVQGFMMPLEPGERQRHFLLTSVPLSCSFCLPGGPESMIEVRTKTPVKYSMMEPVVVEGKFQVLNDDPYGLYYRITEAVAVK